MCIIGFMANCYGKWHCESLFGMLRRLALNTSFATIDDVLSMFETINRSEGGVVSGFASNPISSNNWVEILARAGYGTTAHPDFGFVRYNPHHACDCAPGARAQQPEDVLAVLDPFLPREENCVRISSWLPVEGRQEPLPLDKRPLEVPAARSRPRDVAKAGEGEKNGVYWTDVITPTQPFSSGGDRVVSQRTAKIVCYNSSSFEKYAVELCGRSELVSRSWPEDMQRPYIPNGPPVKAAPQNWSVRRPSHHFKGPEEKPVPRYPPVNLLNALDGSGPRHFSTRHVLTRTYDEPPFPVVPGTCAAKAMRRLYGDSVLDVGRPVSVLEVYRAVRIEMGMDGEEGIGEFLETKAISASPTALCMLEKFFVENRAINRIRLGMKRTAKQIFR